KILVTDAEVDNYLATVASQAGGEREYLLSHIYVTVPEQASADQIETRRRRAEDALAQIKSGKEFAEVAAGFSDAPDATSGGSLGWRTPARLPSIFADSVPDFARAIDKLSLHELSAPVRTPFGWHLIEVIERRKQDITLERRREQARRALRERKSEEQFQEFVRQTRDRAYVEYKVDER